MLCFESYLGIGEQKAMAWVSCCDCIKYIILTIGNLAVGAMEGHMETYTFGILYNNLQYIKDK